MLSKTAVTPTYRMTNWTLEKLDWNQEIYGNQEPSFPKSPKLEEIEEIKYRPQIWKYKDQDMD